MGIRADRTAETRRRLVEVATAMFLDEGYQAVSLRALARRAGTTSGAIYAHFTSKADLLGATLAARLRDFDPRRFVDAAVPSELPAASTAATAREYPERATFRRLLLEVASAGRADPELRDRMHDYFEQALAKWSAEIAAWQQAGRIDAGLDPRAAALHFYTTELGLAVFEAFGVALPAPEEWAAVMGAAMEGLGAEGRLRRTGSAEGEGLGAEGHLRKVTVSPPRVRKRA